MAHASLHTVYIVELKNLYNAEQQLVKALPQLVKSTTSQDLSDAFASHLEETKNHVTRLEEIFQSLGENSKGKKCVGMEGIVKEGAETIDDLSGKVLDAGLISAVQRVEHYEMAAYGSVCAHAQLLNRSEDLCLLEKTLEEEKRADEKLTDLAETIHREAMQELGPRRATTREIVRQRKTRSAA